MKTLDHLCVTRFSSYTTPVHVFFELCSVHTLVVYENVHQVGRILFETNVITTQLAIFDLLKKAADGGRNVEVNRTLLVV